MHVLLVYRSISPLLVRQREQIPWTRVKLEVLSKVRVVNSIDHAKVSEIQILWRFCPNSRSVLRVQAFICLNL